MTLPDGFLDHRPVSASGKPLTGRFVCHDIQWTGTGEDLIGTFTITVRELLAAAESNLIWTDQDVQRGVRPECSQAPRQLSLANGYPNKDTYIFVEENADEIAEKLLHGRRLEHAHRRAAAKAVRTKRWGVPGLRWMPGEDHLED